MPTTNFSDNLLNTYQFLSNTDVQRDLDLITFCGKNYTDNREKAEKISRAFAFRPDKLIFLTALK